MCQAKAYIFHFTQSATHCIYIGAPFSKVSMKILQMYFEFLALSFMLRYQEDPPLQYLWCKSDEKVDISVLKCLK